MDPFYIILYSSIPVVVIFFIILMVYVCTDACKGTKCKYCHHKKHRGECHHRVFCSICLHKHGRYGCHAMKEETYTDYEDVRKPITETYSMEEDVVKYKTEVKTYEKQIPIQNPRTRQVYKTRRIPIQRSRQVSYTDYETRHTQHYCPYQGGNGYTTYSSETVPILKYRTEMYTDYTDEPYYDTETYYETTYETKVVTEPVKIPYTVREMVQKTRTTGYKTVKEQVTKTRHIPCKCKRLIGCDCRRYSFWLIIKSLITCGCRSPVGHPECFCCMA